MVTTATGSQPASSTLTPAQYDALLDDVIQHTDASKLQAGSLAWQTLSTKLAAYLNGSPTAAATALEPALGPLVQQHLGSWTGQAAQAFLKAVSQVSDFAGNVASAMYNSVGENLNAYEVPTPATFHVTVSNLQDMLAFVQTEHAYVRNSYNNWVTAVVNALLADVTNGSSATAAHNSGTPGSDWSTTRFTWVWTPYPTHGPYRQGGTYVFTIDDGVEHHPTPAIEASTGRGGLVLGWTATDLANWVRQTFTQQYVQRVSPIADLVAGSNSIYVKAAQTLPSKIDESSLPGGSPHSGSGPGNGSGAGPGAGPGGLSAGGAGAFGAGGASGLGPGGTHGLGTSGAGGGFGPGGAGGGSGGGISGGSGPGFGGGSGSGSLGGGSASGPGLTYPGGSGGLGGGNPGSFGGGSGPTHLAGYHPVPGGGAGLSMPGGGGGPVLPGGGAGGIGGGAGGFGGGTAGIGAAGLGAAGSAGSGLGSALGAGGAAGGAGAGLAGASGAAGRAMPMMPPMMPPMMGAGNDKDRPRKSWLPEDEDIWAADTDVVPPVISGDS